MIAHSDAPWTPHYCRAFAAAGDAVRLVSFAPKRIDGVQMDFIGVEPYDPTANKSLVVTRVPRVRRIIRDFRPDVLLAPYVQSNGLTARLAWRGPLVLSVRGAEVLEQASRSPLRAALRRRLMRWILAGGDIVHVVSREIEQAVLALGVSAERVHCFPSGILTQRFAPPPDLPRPVARRIICTRKHDPIYDNGVILEALAALRRAGRDVACEFVGDGLLTTELRAQASRLGLDDAAHFAGALPHDELPQRLGAADIYVSAARSDGTSSALLEALAVGLTPVVTRIPANLPWIEDGQTGLLFTPGRADELATALARALDDVELRRRAFAGNRARVAHEGDFDHNIQRLHDLLARAIREHT